MISPKRHLHANLSHEAYDGLKRLSRDHKLSMSAYLERIGWARWEKLTKAEQQQLRDHWPTTEETEG